MNNVIPFQPAPILITKEELAMRLSMTPDQVMELYRARAIPAVKLGHKTIRFDFDAVMKAIQKRVVKEAA